MNEEATRKAFEAWALSERLDIRRLGDGTYLLLTVQEKWVGWQAATRAAVPESIRHLADVMVRESKGVPVVTDWHDAALTVCEWIAAAPEAKP